ncbi:hypothetical protein SNE25_09590 [Mucilaginibacter sabulilitoris]|uniref:Plasmid transfer protein n=1 Tax=Mucilaginibacter sabulilitoris TaxID=1173583 RepID=A0ABZ0TXB9_9SPHI|nr:hypothetical protein [Mucilaginibacter sabulilitoris]WPU95770.1 hypothetical protein SNE25_09590 [Mucilaginibacter sabulilitoris]
MKQLILFFCCLPAVVQAQSIIFDKGHFAAVNENAAARETAEMTHFHYLTVIRDRLDDINLDMTSVVLVQQMVKNSLTKVDDALKNGQDLVQISQIVNELITAGNEMIDAAQADPLLLVFTEQVAGQLKARAINLVTEVSGFILKEQDEILMDFEKRDALLRKIIGELKVMRALAYSMNRSIYWARQQSLWKAVDPFRDFVNQDTRLTDEIISKLTSNK